MPPHPSDMPDLDPWDRRLAAEMDDGRPVYHAPPDDEPGEEPPARDPPTEDRP